MQYSTIFLAALAATGATAAPQHQARSADRPVRVVLLGPGELGSQTTFPERDVVSRRPIGSSGPYDTVELRLDDNINNEELRCQILDNSHNPIQVERGANLDTTFADGGNGPWTFKNGASLVSKIICDQSFEKGSADPEGRDNEVDNISVLLQSQTTGSNTQFTEGLVESKSPTGSTGPFDTVTLRLDEGVDPEYRCQILDDNHDPIELQRGENEAETFADGGKGAWTFKNGSARVSQIICDPEF